MELFDRDNGIGQGCHIGYGIAFNVHVLVGETSYQLRLDFQIINFAVICFQLISGIATVSYTHLDVYKRQLLNRLDQQVKTAFIFNPCFSDVQLLQLILRDLGIANHKTSDKLELIESLNA